MRATPTMQRIITRIAAKHTMNLETVGAPLCLDMPGYDRLTIEVLTWNRLSVAHTYAVQGQRFPDPNVEFAIWGDHWFPISMTQTLTGLRTYVILSDDKRRIVHINKRGQAGLAAFCETWARTLIDQGWLENAVNHKAAAGSRMALPAGSTPRFPLGHVVATPGALAALERTGQTPQAFLMRHVTGDFGELDEHDRQANEHALEFGGRLLSAYRLQDGSRLWLITESDRSATTILRPDEY